jgi:chromosomal replication initiation ATPase DnaA
MNTQIPLPIKSCVSYSIDGFVRVSEQSDILKYYDDLSKIPPHGLYIYGPPKSGKTQLAHLFQHKGVKKIASIEDIFKLQEKELVFVDDFISEIDLFHIVNHIIGLRCKILIFLPFYPEMIVLPDLKSRLKLLEIIEIKKTSEEFMKVLFFKQFSNHQILVQEDVVDFLIARISREYSVIAEIVEILNQESIINKRAITIPFVKEILSL